MPDSRSDERLVAEVMRATQALYERQRQIQDGTGVVASVFGRSLGSGPQTLSGAGSGRTRALRNRE